MAKSIGIMLSRRIFSGLVDDHDVQGEMHHYPEDREQNYGLVELPKEALAEVLRDQIVAATGGQEVEAIGIAVPGIIRAGVVEDSPNLPQLKGARITDLVTELLLERGVKAPVLALNDADATAAGLAATRRQLDRLVRVWTLGYGIGYGRYPWIEGVWEGGHMVVTLDPKETYCGCGGLGHLEGIMGHRAMRLRFLDLEPEEIFAHAKKGDTRCMEFVRLWHRALAAAVANSIHMEGAGKFYFTGPNVGFLEMPRLKDYLHQMVTMSPLQSYSLEACDTSDDLAVIGAAVNAVQARS